MTRGIGFKPEFEVSVTVRKIPHEYARSVTDVFGGALEEINDLAKLSSGGAAGIEAALELSTKEMTFEEQKDAMFRLALEKTEGNIRAAAKLLAISERTMYRWVRSKGKQALQLGGVQ